MTVFAKGKGSRYRNDLADPYQATKTSAEKAAKKAPKQTADRGPINVTFDAGDDTEEYFLFVRKVRGDGDQDATKDASASSASSSSKAASAEIAAALGMKPNDAVPAVASIGAWLPLGDVVMEAGADLDVVVAERREILTSFAKRKHLKLLPILDDERLVAPHIALIVGDCEQRRPGHENIAQHAAAVFQGEMVEEVAAE